MDVHHSLLHIKYLRAFALPKKYSHCRLHEYKLNFEFILRFFSNRADATKSLHPTFLFFYHIVLLPPLPSSITPLPFSSDSSSHNERNRHWFLNSSLSNMTTGSGQDPGGHTYLELLQQQENTLVANAPKPAVSINGSYSAWVTWGSFLVTRQPGRLDSEQSSLVLSHTDRVSGEVFYSCL